MVTLSQIFSDGAVFAANRPIRVFGEGCGRVEVDFVGMHRALDTTGGWCIELEPLPYGGPYEMTVSLDGEKTVLRDLWVGEVLLCSGQSNMEFRMINSKEYPERCEPCSALRVFCAERVDQKGIFRPMHGWKRCDCDEVIKHTTAVGYQTGLLVAKRLGCAVGLLSVSQGASVIQSWMPEGAIERIGLHFTKEELGDSHFNYPLWNPPGCLYHTMLEPWLPYSVSNVLWYQGESNTATAESMVYKQMLSELIRIWREAFRDPKLPFTVVQIADCHMMMKKRVGWRIVQEAQMQIQHEVAGVTTVTCADVCETDDIHPPTKRYLAERIADLLCNQ